MDVCLYHPDVLLRTKKRGSFLNKKWEANPDNGGVCARCERLSYVKAGGNIEDLPRPTLAASDDIVLPEGELFMKVTSTLMTVFTLNMTSTWDWSEVTCKFDGADFNWSCFNGAELSESGCMKNCHWTDVEHREGKKEHRFNIISESGGTKLMELAAASVEEKQKWTSAMPEGKRHTGCWQIVDQGIVYNAGEWSCCDCEDENGKYCIGRNFSCGDGGGLPPQAGGTPRKQGGSPRVSTSDLSTT
jgi:hypothetical protein